MVKLLELQAITAIHGDEIKVAVNLYHQFPIFCEKRDELQEYLKENGIQTLIHYPIPSHK